MSNQKRQKPVHFSPLGRAKTLPRKLCLWLRNNIPLGLCFVSYALVGFATLLIVAGFVILLMGQSGTVSSFIDHNFGGYGGIISGTGSVKQQNWTWVLIKNFYAYLLPLIYAVIIILPTIGVVFLLSILRLLGRLVMKLSYSLTGRNNLSVRLLSTLIVWTLAIVLVWLTINADPVIYVLLGMVGLLLANTALFAGENYWRQKWPRINNTALGSKIGGKK